MMASGSADYLRRAYEIATGSPDPSTQNGAIITSPSGLVLSWGCNTFPNGVATTDARLVRPLKYQVIEHAERNAIYAAAKSGQVLNSATMYCPWFACADCARAIIQAGIARVVGHKACMDMTPPHWKESIAVAFEMLDEAGVQWELHEGAIGDCGPLRFNGELWRP